jgi:hypothetical protein
MTNNLRIPTLSRSSATDAERPGDLLFNFSIFFFQFTCLRVVGQVRSGDGTVAQVGLQYVVLYFTGLVLVSSCLPVLGLFLASTLSVVCLSVFLSTHQSSPPVSRPASQSFKSFRQSTASVFS